jgi:hypothetical protein
MPALPPPPPYPLQAWRKGDVKQLVVAVRSLIVCPVFCGILSEMATMDKDTVKKWSHHGFLCIEGRQVDAGNKVYTAFVMLALHFGEWL